MPSVDRYSCSISTSGVTRVKKKAWMRKTMAVIGSAQPITRRVPSRITSTASTAHARSAFVRSSM